MKKTFIKSLSLLLAALMLMTALPMGVFAENHVHSYNWVSAKDATATEHGNIGYYACSCGKYFATPGGSEISASSVVVHNFDKWAASGSEHRKSEATCQKKAVYYKKCTVCDTYSETETFEIGSTIPHTPEDELEWTVPAGADCTKAAFTRTKNCLMCGTPVKSETIAVGSHDLKLVPAEAATCKKAGHENGEQCTKCQKWTWGGATIPKKDHSMVVVKGEEAIAATCTVPGRTAGMNCQYCGEQYKKPEVIPAKGHDYQKVTKRAVTCMEDGYTEDGELCVRCGLVVKPDKYFGKTNAIVVKAPGKHVYNYKPYTAPAVSHEGCKEHWECTASKDADGNTITEYFIRPTRQVDGAVFAIKVTDKEAKNYTLNDGTYVYQQVTKSDVITDPLPHEHSWKVNKAKSVAKTCLKDGKEVSYCEICGKEIETPLLATGHQYEWVVTKPATCKEKGIKVETCKVCKTTNRTEEIPLAAHDLKLTGKVDCTKGGNAVYQCANCGYTETKAVAKRDSHKDDNHDGYCDECGTQFCTCLCHNDKWYGKLLYYFVKIWWQYFGIKEKCECGVVHYTKTQTNVVPNVT
ncbi:MAG: hypothetical protein IJU56_03335 [Clostridia bacterium]|nr:hypothetical protein [Clostridia bacterium]